MKIKNNKTLKSLTADYNIEEIQIGEINDLQLDDFLKSDIFNSSMRCQYCNTVLLSAGEYIKDTTITHDIISKIKICAQCKTSFEFIYHYTKEVSYLKLYMKANNLHVISPQTYIDS